MWNHVTNKHGEMFLLAFERGPHPSTFSNRVCQPKKNRRIASTEAVMSEHPANPRVQGLKLYRFRMKVADSLTRVLTSLLLFSPSLFLSPSAILIPLHRCISLAKDSHRGFKPLKFRGRESDSRKRH